MAYVQREAILIKKEKLNDTVFRFTLKEDVISDIAVAGQFINIKCGEKTLRRPISICQIDKKHNCIVIVFEVRGEGTQWLSQCYEHDKIDIMGPLGNGFDTEKQGKALLIGGGIGVPPLLSVAESMQCECDAILGFRNIEATILVDEFSEKCKDVMVMTDDGTYGDKGFVTDALLQKLETNDYSVICACGPTPMLKAISDIAIKIGVECYVSLEERMGCGIGACLVCACKTKNKDEEKYSHVCKDGPVFKAEEVVW